MINVTERAFTLCDAEKIIDGFFSENGISVQVDQYGNPLSSTMITLDTSYSSLDFIEKNENVGCGKGYEDEARVGAKFEAYEHHFAVHMLQRAQTLKTCSNVIEQDIFSGLIPLTILKPGKNAHLSVIHFEGNPEIEQPDLFFPSFLINYRYSINPLTGDDTDYGFAKRYSCGTGIAAGASYDEAAVHALSEVAERDAVGRFLAKHFFFESQQSVVFLSVSSLSEAAQNTLDDAERVLADKIMIIDVTEQDNCPVYIAYCKEKRIEGVNVFGAGASRYPEHAVLRAVKELVQQYMIAANQVDVPPIWKKAYENSGINERLRRCIELDLTSPRFDGRKIVRDIRASVPTVSLPMQTAILKRGFMSQGRAVWLKILHQHHSGLHLVCAAMPRMERFSLAALGGQVVPCFEKAAYV